VQIINFWPAELPPRQQLHQPDLEPESDRVVIPTDLMFAAWRQLFPAERMVVFGGRTTRRGVRVSSLSDVTEPTPSAAHVRACPAKLGTALVDLDRTGSHLAVWMHSHPGEGARATHPSTTDLNQDRDLRLHYSDKLVGIIAVRDGWLRVFGEAVERGQIRLGWLGQGIQEAQGERHVYRLCLS
jgi:proteasome lid subunit RPN8/RPN11